MPRRQRRRDAEKRPTAEERPTDAGVLRSDTAIATRPRDTAYEKLYRKRPLLGTEFLGDVSISVGAIEEPPDFSMHRLAVHGDFMNLFSRPRESFSMEFAFLLDFSWGLPAPVGL